MSTNFNSLFVRRRNGGFALVLVLSFVVLLTVVILAFFSNSMLQRTVADSSSKQTTADVFAQGAVDSILSDLKQEVADGSIAGGTPVFTNGAAVKKIYVPSTNSVVMPYRAGSDPSWTNLVKRSAHGVSFYPGNPSYSSTGSSRAADVSSSVPSINGRSFSAARWNKALLLPATSTTDLTPNTSVPFSVPDWVLVNRSGSNPTAWNVNLRWAADASNTNAVVGRYAFAVYDIGGLLDANVAGYPSNAGIVATNAAFKGAAAYAELGELFEKAGASSSDATQYVDALVKWRNAATLGGDPKNYSAYVANNPVGFVKTANTNLVGGVSDRMFASRQQLIDFVVNSSGGAGSALQGVLQYLTHFSRDLNQPSLMRASGRPTVQNLNSGGNYEGPGKDDAINPSFLNLRVLTSVPGGRNDGDDLLAGEPLVKRRFALNRLAWLTYMGPSSGRAGVDVSELKDTFLYTQEFLNKGTASNIEKYFGLRWNSSGFWEYNVHVSSTGIKTLAEVQAGNREPDFFELLKASIGAGTIGKSFFQAGNVAAVAVQFTSDSSLDFQIIQIGANIIDQFDVDGYPTRIQFLGGGLSTAKEFRGVENLPYLNRVRAMAWRVVDPAPMPANRDTQKQGPPQLTITGSGTVVMAVSPEVWNPHNYNAADLNRSLGNPRPQNLRFYAYSAAPALPPATPNTAGFGFYIFGRTGTSTASFSYSTPLGPRSLNAGNSRIDFNNDGSFFREPTLLIKADSAIGLTAPGLAAADGAAGDGISASANGITVVGGPPTAGEPGPAASAGLYLGIYVGKAPLMWNGGSGSSATTYLASGIFANASSNPHNEVMPEVTYQVLCDNPNASGGGVFEVYDEKYGALTHLTSNPVTAQTPNQRTLLSAAYPDYMLGVTRFSSVFDPRTSRFGLNYSRQYELQGGAQNEIAPYGRTSNPKPAWLVASKSVVHSQRPDNNAGYGQSDFQSSANVVPPGWSLNIGSSGVPLRHGLISQNSTDAAKAANNARRFAGDNAGNAGSPSQQYYMDADGVVRRGMAAYTDTSASLPDGAVGLPMATSFEVPLNARQRESRPIILNRPFRSVAELGYVFSDTPWKNLDFSTAESGFSGLLDVFCIADSERSSGLVAGKVNLNTKQVVVLESILKGAYRDEYKPTSVSASNIANQIDASDAAVIAGSLASRTASSTSGQGPLANLSELTGKWLSGSGSSALFSGFSDDLASGDVYASNIARYREAPIRALAAAGQTRIWNLMIDVVAQTGRYPQTADGLGKFLVEGEQRLWVHIALDRLTGEVLEKQVEIVKE